LGKTACESLTDPAFDEQDSLRESWGQCDNLGSVALFSGAFFAIGYGFQALIARHRRAIVGAKFYQRHPELNP
jgi:hypothetical protein